jgi:anti-sigma factor RsiW
MNKHLSSEQFAKCFAGECTSAELQHIRKCTECSAELDRVGNAFSAFRSALRDRIDNRVASQAPVTFQFPVDAAVARRKWGEVLAVAAVVLLGVFPFFMSEMKTDEALDNASTQASADALMDAINLHLSRTIPSPMEPVMFLIPTEKSTGKIGGVQ